jgi:hypothetical protein
MKFCSVGAALLHANKHKDRAGNARLTASFYNWSAKALIYMPYLTES